MFHPDIVSLKRFYATPLGMLAQRMLMARIRRWWPAAPRETILGIGHVSIYLEPYLADAAQIAVIHPALQGAAYWPLAGANRAVLCEDGVLPLPDSMFNRVLIVHAAEHSDQLEDMMREVWRVLVPGGRVLAVLPNRLGVWARSHRSPFGYGEPFTLAQWREVLSGAQLTVTRDASALFLPPWRGELLLRLANGFEWIGRMLGLMLGGVLMIEAEKQIYAAIGQPAIARASRPLPEPVAEPVLGKLTPRI